MGKRYKWDSWRDINGEYKDIFSKDFMNWGFSVSRILHFILSEVLNYVQEFGSTFAVQIVAQISTHRLQEVGTINNILNIMTSLTMFFTLFHEHVMFFFFFLIAFYEEDDCMSSYEWSLDEYYRKKHFRPQIQYCLGRQPLHRRRCRRCRSWSRSRRTRNLAYLRRRRFWRQTLPRLSHLVDSMIIWM